MSLSAAHRRLRDAAAALRRDEVARAARLLRGLRHPLADLLRAQVHWERGRHASALRDFAKAKRVMRVLPPWYAACEGECLILSGRPGARAFDRAVAAAAPGERAALLAWRGQTRLWRGDLDAAWADLQAALRLDPRYAWAHGWKAGVLCLRGRLAQALKAARAALRLDPGDNEAAVWEGEILRRMGRPREALKALSRRNDETSVFWQRVNRELCLAALGRKKVDAARLERLLTAAKGNRAHPPRRLSAGGGSRPRLRR